MNIQRRDEDRKLVTAKFDTSFNNDFIYWKGFGTLSEYELGGSNKTNHRSAGFNLKYFTSKDKDSFKNGLET